MYWVEIGFNYWPSGTVLVEYPPPWPAGNYAYVKPLEQGVMPLSPAHTWSSWRETGGIFISRANLKPAPVTVAYQDFERIYSQGE